MERYSIDDDGYFGISHLAMGSYGAQLMNNSVMSSQQRGITFYFEEAGTQYQPDKRALTIEGNAGTHSTSTFALHALESYANVAREMDELMKPLAG